MANGRRKELYLEVLREKKTWKSWAGRGTKNVTKGTWPTCRLRERMLSKSGRETIYGLGSWSEIRFTQRSVPVVRKP
jgi:hypothetical protein